MCAWPWSSKMTSKTRASCPTRRGTLMFWSINYFLLVLNKEIFVEIFVTYTCYGLKRIWLFEECEGGFYRSLCDSTCCRCLPWFVYVFTKRTGKFIDLQKYLNVYESKVRGNKELNRKEVSSYKYVYRNIKKQLKYKYILNIYDANCFVFIIFFYFL